MKDIDLCKAMLHYVMEKFDLRPSEAKKEMLKFFDSETVDTAQQSDCGHACGFVEPYGFVPEDGCPVHDLQKE